MRILVLSNIEWSDNNAFGNTLSNLFGNIDDIEIASLYRRSSKPVNNVCSKYYKISYTSIIRSFFNKEKIGEYFVSSTASSSDGVLAEKNAISIIHKLRLSGLVNFVNDLLFMTKRWDNKSFRDFIEDFKPDIVFCFTRCCAVQNLFIRTIKKYAPHCKCVTFIADDLLAEKGTQRHKKILGEQLSYASKIYAITPSLKEKYEGIFGVNIDILTKGCDFSLPVIRKYNKEKTIVYAGNLLYGRDKALISLAREIKKHNDSSENRLRLKIFSPTVVGDEVKGAMNIEGASEFSGARPYSEIVKILNQSDAVLHIESFEEEQQRIVKHSFSTKITDCMQSGSVLFAIGPRGIASIDITSEIPGAFVADSLDELSRVIEDIADADLYENALQTRKYAVEHFSIEKIQQRLLADLRSVIG